jgi:molybdate transport system substrate-binding protein
MAGTTKDHSMKKVKFIFLMAFLMGLSAFVYSQQPPKTTIAAAADLKFAMDSLVTAYKIQNPGAEMEVVYGSSGKFFEQITNDAPFDLFFSADQDYPARLKGRGLTIGEIKIYGIGQIVIWSKKTDPGKNQMRSLLEAGISKIAIANPAHAPYGKRAEESLKYYQLYDQIQNKLVFGENISQTAQFITSGAADIGIVALSLALSPAMKNEGGKYFIIPEESHAPLEQAYTLLKHAGGNAGAAHFYSFISSPAAISILRYYGFSQKTK